MVTDLLFGAINPLSVNPPKMVKHTQKIRRMFLTNSLSVSNHFVALAPTGLWELEINIRGNNLKNSTPSVQYRIQSSYSKKLLATTLKTLFLTLLFPTSQLFYYT